MSAPADPGPRPDVVVIYADDLGWGDLSCFGSTEVSTPHLDAMAEQGLRMTSWYANSPVCSPSRASLLTGREPAHAGVEEILGAQRDVVGLPPQPTLASLLSGAGYETALFGKWHLGVEADSAPTRRGFHEHKGFRAGCVDYYSHIMYWGVRNPLHDLWSGDQEIWRNGEYLTEMITDWAVEKIRGSRGPLFCYVAYNAPHYPMHAPQPYMDRFAHLPWEKQVMAAMIACLDDGVGRIVAALEETGRRDNTIILFSSDNGPSSEERNWLAGEEVAYQGGSAGGLHGHKGSLWDGGIRVPTIWSWPAGLPSGDTSDLPARMCDVVPTILAAAGVAAPAGLDGDDLLTSLRRGSGPERAMCWEFEGQHAVRRGRWKLLTDPSPRLGAPREPGQLLFDLDADPGEQHDLAAQHPDVVAELVALRDAHRRRVEGWRHERVGQEARPASGAAAEAVAR